MDKTPQEIEAIYAKFEKIGETQVRINLDTNKYGEASGKRALARIWLDDRSKDNAKELWHKTCPGIIIIGVSIGLCVAYLSYRFGWFGAPE